MQTQANIPAFSAVYFTIHQFKTGIRRCIIGIFDYTTFTMARYSYIQAIVKVQAHGRSLENFTIVFSGHQPDIKPGTCQLFPQEKRQTQKT